MPGGPAPGTPLDVAAVGLCGDCRHALDPVVDTGGCDTPGHAYAVAVAGSYAYVADGFDGGLRVVDVSDPGAPVEVGHLGDLSIALGVAVAGDFAYVAERSYGKPRYAGMLMPSRAG